MFEFELVKMASENDMDGIRRAIRSEGYTLDKARMAISIAFTHGHNEIAYEILSMPGAWEEYVNTQFSPFVVMDKLEECIRKYKHYNDCQNRYH